MTWKLLDDKKILANLGHEKRTCVRVVMLNLPDAMTSASLDEWIDRDAGSMMDSAFERKYEIHAYRTQPATAAIFEKNSGELFGAYVWTGKGSQIVTARDHRMRILADMLDAHLHESATPIDQAYEDEPVCECCGDKYTHDEGGDTHVTDIDIGNGVRMEKRELDAEDVFVIIARYASEKQQKIMGELLELGAYVEAIVNLRPLGSGAVGEIVIRMTGPYGEMLDIMPSGELEADF